MEHQVKLETMVVCRWSYWSVCSLSLSLPSLQPQKRLYKYMLGVMYAVLFYFNKSTALLCPLIIVICASYFFF